MIFQRLAVRRGASLVVPVAAMALVLGCVVPPPQPEPMPGMPTDLAGFALTRDGEGHYRVTGNAGSFTVAGADAGGGNVRTIVWPAAATASVDQTSCATWTEQSAWTNQQGVALRIQPTGTGVRAITVTRNVWLWDHQFNVHVWDTDAAPGVLNGVGSVFVSPALGAPSVAPPDLPWRLCARVVAATVEIKVWPTAVTEPAWGDPAHSGVVALPDGWDGAGVPGWYAGHLNPGDHVTSTDLATA